MDQHNKLLFPGDLIQVASSIRSLYKSLPFDHRPFLSQEHPDYSDHCTEEFRIGYACFKYAVAKILQPQSILEIGVFGGTSALAFLHACPSARYVGIDNGAEDRHRHTHLLDDAEKIITQRFDATIIRADSQELKELDRYDFIHIDGLHSYEGVQHDAALALYSGCNWILFDDAREPAVAAGCFKAISDARPMPLEWSYFEDTWTGSILVWTGQPR